MKKLTKKVTKKEIQKTLRSENVTAIFKIAAKSNVDTSNRMEVLRFIEKYAPSKKVYKKAYRIAMTKRCHYYNLPSSILPTKRGEVILKAKTEKKDGKSNYSKILIEGNDYIYWASPVYKHNDYNKSVAMTNTEKNRELMKLVNSYLK